MPNWRKVIVSGSDAVLTSVTATAGFTGSLQGTASYATNALSASYAQTSSYATYAANGGVTKILAGANVNLSPVNGLGDVTVTSFGTNLYNTATGSYGSFYDTGSVLATSATAVYSMSLSTTDISNGVFVSASNGDVTRVKFTNAGTYNLQFSSQFSNTDNSNQDVVIWVRKNGVDIPDSSGVATTPPFKAGSNGQVIAAWNYYLSLSADDFIQMCWHVEQANVITLETIPAGVGPTHPRTPSTILTATRVDTFLSNTGSFSGSFTGTLLGTASYATQALSASYAPDTTFPYTGSARIAGSLGITGSFNQASASLASGLFAHVQGIAVTASGDYSHAEGRSTTASGSYSHAEGDNTRANGSYSHAEGTFAVATGAGSHAEGAATTATGISSHAEGDSTIAFGYASHAEGQDTDANGSYSHAEGYNTTATGSYSHAEGSSTTATGNYSHAEGYGGNAFGYASHAEGFFTVASGSYQHVQGQYNLSSSAQSAFIVGNGTGTGALRSNLIFASGSTLQVTGSVIATAGFTGSLQGTASFALAVAGGGAAFPFTGSATISGSLVVNQNATTGSLNTDSRTLQDDRNKSTIDWNNRLLYDAQIAPVQSADWNHRALYSSAGADSVQWDNRYLYDSAGYSSVDWGHRSLTNENSDPALNWDVIANGYAIGSNYYYRSLITFTEQQGFIDTVPTNTNWVNYAGEVIRATVDASVVDHDLVYLYTDGVWYQLTQGSQNCTKLIGICVDKSAGTILLEGTLTVLSTHATYSDSPLVQGVDSGLPIYIRDSNGTEMSAIAPSNSGQVVRVLGHAYQQGDTYTDYWIMKFRPSNDWITI